MTKFLSPLLLLALLVPLSAAPKKQAGKADASARPKMIKIVAQLIQIKVTGEVNEKPKTLYRAGKTFARVEEEKDPQADEHRLLITNEPDVWAINLNNKTGKHIVDEGPEYEAKLPVFWGLDGRPDPDFGDLEFGHELEFFGEGRGMDGGVREVDGKKYKTMTMKTGEHEIIMFLDEKKRPYRINLFRWGRMTSAVRYLSYETNLPFNKALFTPPKGIAFREAGE